MSIYYTAPGTPTLRSRLSSEEIRDQFAALEQAFNLLPGALSGGNVGFTGGRWEGGTLQGATVIGSTLGSVVSPNIGYFSNLHLVGSTTVSVGSDRKAFILDTTGSLRYYADSTAYLLIDPSGNVIIGDGTNEKGTTATAGFLYLPTQNGPATGVPTVYNAAVPAVVDRSNRNLGLYIGGAWAWVGIPYTGSATYDPPSLADGAGVTTTVTCTGAAVGMFAKAAFSQPLLGVTVTAWVSAANTVSVQFQNESGGVVDLASGTLKVAASDK